MAGKLYAETFCLLTTTRTEPRQRGKPLVHQSNIQGAVNMSFFPESATHKVFVVSLKNPVPPMS